MTNTLYPRSRMPFFLLLYIHVHVSSTAYWLREQYNLCVLQGNRFFLLFYGSLPPSPRTYFGTKRRREEGTVNSEEEGRRQQAQTHILSFFLLSFLSKGIDLQACLTRTISNQKAKGKTTVTFGTTMNVYGSLMPLLRGRHIFWGISCLKEPLSLISLIISWLHCGQQNGN